MTSPRPLIALALGLALAPAAFAEGKLPRKPPTEESEHARLQKEIDQDRAVLRKMLQQQKEQADQTLRLLGKERGGAPAETSAATPLAPDSTRPAETTPARDAIRAERSEPRPRGGSGVLTGKVQLEGGATDAVVYVVDVRGKPAKDNVLTIRQANKQFQPRFAVVPRGTQLVLPNDDSIFHNAFSLSPGNSFDLGTYRAGDQPGAVTLSTAGVVKIFCNIHSQMSASVLVVPNTLFAQVKADGTFRLSGIPPGKHQLAAWTPNSEPVVRELEIEPGDNTAVTFTVSGKPGQAHTNKFGQAYGSYAE